MQQASLTARLTGLVATVAAAVVVLSGPATAPAVAGPTADPQVTMGQKMIVSVLPAVAQPGPGPAAARSASVPVTVRLVPVRPGRLVTLTAQTGRQWEVVGTAALSAAGVAEFRVDTTGLAGAPKYFRAHASPLRGVPAVSSKIASAWRAPVFTDEFDGDALSSSWTDRGTTHSPAALRACSKGSREATEVEGGTLRLKVQLDPDEQAPCTARRADGSVIGDFPYRLNGHIGTQQSFGFTYGIAAARVRFQEARGQHGAFWMQPTVMVPGATDAATGGAEIDVIEFFGYGTAQQTANALRTTVYHPTPTGQQSVGGIIPDNTRFLNGPSDSWSGGYHVFSVEWTPTEYVFRIDGRETFRTSTGVSQRQQYLILSLLSSDFELPNLNGTLPQTMEVDWVQVWQR